jgi:CubicO group peptidase (beta-lactamase class C family)
MKRDHGNHIGRRVRAALLGAAVVTTAVACGGGGAEDAATTSSVDDSMVTPAEEPWESDAQAVLDSAIAPGGVTVNAAGAVADGAVMGVRLPDGRQYVFTTGVDTDGTPVEADGTFLVGYLTRTVVDMTVWELAEAGEIDLNAPIAPWAPTIPNADEITLEMLMNATSGVGDPIEELQEALLGGQDRAWSLEESIEVISRVPPLAAPGATTLSGDAGPGVIMGYVLEEATGRPLDELVAEYVTEPLGLESVAFVTLDRLPTEGGRVVDPDLTLDIADADVNAAAWVTGGAPAWGIQSDMADLLTAFDALAAGALPGPDQAPRPSAYPPDRHLPDAGLTLGVDTPLVAYCPCTGDAEDRSHSSYGRSSALAGTSLTYVNFPDSGISMSLRLNAAAAEGPDMRRPLYEVHDLINGSS